eukprot:TRINITY_DN15432_c0_g1_i1.p1 TRINITY_DN15432_c0_g1~~TRINITY_DN15432_c0_g1_i1.p1  ORF type:complete len:114 (-),score=23.75 TRINITY_DN15432_c0_g1_i1:36-377(-)
MKRFSSLEDLAEAVAETARADYVRERKDKESLFNYLADRKCPLFTAKGNKMKHISSFDVNQFFKLEKTGPGSVALLKEVGNTGQQFDHIDDLMQIGRAVQQECRDRSRMPSSA